MGFNSAFKGLTKKLLKGKGTSKQDNK